jgi:DNA end-binding protein Ku
LTGDFEPEKFEDRYENAMIDLIRSKQAGLPAPKEKAPARPANVVNSMGALRSSIEGADSRKAKATKASAMKTEIPARPKRKTAKG